MSSSPSKLKSGRPSVKSKSSGSSRKGGSTKKSVRSVLKSYASTGTSSAPTISQLIGAVNDVDATFDELKDDGFTKYDVHMLKQELVLHEAARKNNYAKVKELIQRKVDVNAKNNLDRTALQWSAANGHNEIMQLLIKYSADIEAQDKYGMTALLWGAWFGHKMAVMILVNAGGNPDNKNRQGLNILHCASLNNHECILQFIVDSLEIFDVNDVEKDEKTALHLAASKGHLDIVKKLLEMNCKLSKKDTAGQTAVHLAAAEGHHDTLQHFLQVGVEIDDRDTEGRTALHLAAENGHAKVAELLLSHTADPNAETTKEYTPLHIAAMHGQRDVVQVLLEHGSCNVNAQNNQGNTPLHLAAISNHPGMVRQLIDGYAEIDQTNARAQTPLHAAVENGLADVVEVLLIAGSDLEAKEKSGKTALGLASRGSFIGIVDMIIKADHYNGEEELMQELNDSKTSSVASQKSVRDLQFKRPQHECTEFMKDIMWKLATKQLKPGDWKRLAHYWNFTDSHIKAIEHQYTGPSSYKEHAYRLLLIWLHGVKKEESPMKFLFEALTAIDRRELAEHIRRRVLAQGAKQNGANKGCLVS